MSARIYRYGLTKRPALQYGLWKAATGAARRVTEPVRHYGLGSQMSDQDPDTIEREKKRSMERRVKTTKVDLTATERIETAPGWNECLASESEADVKADRQPDPLSMEDLQKSSVGKLLKEIAEKMEGAPSQNGTASKNAQQKNRTKS
ncbi:hypothetical protein BC832DRAFT_190769 [Gaertneriomyces semiglobifer]|nr:hypothetical protein BC832DRAFT_190769 [Gaertneriomyces semiglobifer]